MTDSFKMTQILLLDKFLYKNSIADSIRRAPGLKILQFVGTAIKEKREQKAEGKVKAANRFGGKHDFLERYIEIHEKNKELPPWYTTIPGIDNGRTNSHSA
jgi:hypothetical protein